MKTLTELQKLIIEDKPTEELIKEISSKDYDRDYISLVKIELLKRLLQ